MKTMKRLSVFLATVLMLALLPVQTAFAAGDFDVSITQAMSVVQVQAAIEETIGRAGSDDTITVSGSKTDVDRTLDMYIPVGVRVEWGAEWKGGSSFPDAPLISLAGMGTFEQTSAGSMENPALTGSCIDSSETTVIISGGTVTAIGNNGKAIKTTSGNVIVSDGTVQATGYQTDMVRACAIETGSGNVTVSGGRVEATNQAQAGGIAIYTDSGAVTESSGTVRADGDLSNAIRSDSGDVTVSGGSVEAKASPTIWCTAIRSDYGNITINGGTIKAEGNGCAGVDTYLGNITINGGSLSVAGGSDYAGFGAASDGGTLTMTGGSVSVTGDGFGGALGIGNSTIKVTGGEISVNGTGDVYDIVVFDDANGAAAVLRGICTDYYVENDIGIIVEVDSLSIFETRNGKGTNDAPAVSGLTKTAGQTSAVWDMAGAVPKIKFTLPNGNTREVEWGNKITAPSAPQGFTATVGDKQVTLKWSAPASNGGSAITKYEVSKDNGASWVSAGTGTTYTFTGLTNGTAYTFKARAVNAVGSGAAATATAATTPATTKAQFTYSLSAKAYNGKAQGVTVTPKSNVGKVTAVYYTGTKGTSYKKTTAKPKNIGSYAVTVDVSAGKNTVR